ncbi:hypothetical protein L1987_53505 [Smallanthus sonchifolius]|uniref:Uncharacterized protein n=1 Tax=Smallanthus sonchifolius TaxID=185202 RepID=A0ACB9EWQ4_9ASTR|nr:hypothetical protein L1987_53505 [Smallanthus sonchifolius]
MKKGDDVVPEKPYQVICHIFSGRSRGFGFVTMSSVEEFEEVVCKFYGYISHLSFEPFETDRSYMGEH